MIQHVRTLLAALFVSAALDTQVPCVIKDLNIKLDTLNLIEEKVGNNLEIIVNGNNFLNRTPMVQELRSKNVPSATVT